MNDKQSLTLPLELIQEWMNSEHQNYVVWMIDLLLMVDEKGETQTSVSALSKRWKVHRNTAHKFLDFLTQEKMVVYNPVYNLVYNLTICNIESYKGVVYNPMYNLVYRQEEEKEQEIKKEKEISPYTPSLEKEINKEKEREEEPPQYSARKIFRPPSVDEIYGYAFEKGLKIDAECFHDFYQSKNWMVGKTKMKDWKAAARNWSRRNTSTYNHNGNNTNTSTREERIRNAAALAQYYANTPTECANTAADF